MITRASIRQMAPETDLIHSIEEAIAVSETRLRDSWTAERRGGVIELVRTMDYRQLSSREGQPIAESDPDLDWLYVNGYPGALQTFIDESTSNSGYPLFRSSRESQIWAASALQLAGRMELFRRTLSFCRAGLATLRASEDGLVEVLIASGTGVETVEREDYAWLSQLTARIQQPAMEDLSGKQNYIEGLMMARVYPWRRHFIGYETTPEIDSHFEALGVLYSQHLVGQDSFPGTARFDGVPFDVYRAVTATLIGWSMKHVGFCEMLVRKNPTTEMVNVLTTSRRRDDMIRDLTDALQIEPSEASRALSVLTLNHANVEKHYALSAGAAPPLIAIGDEFLLKSAYGWMSDPYSFMLSGLRRNYRTDWDRGVGLREDMFRSELRNLFKWADVVAPPAGCKLRSGGRVVTDVDAVIFHRPTKTVGLFQLKWQDLFGGSMRIRASRQGNMRRETKDWLDSVASWLSARSGEEKARGLGLDRFGESSVAAVELFVLGRHFAHFSGNEEDDRAAWGHWSQVLRIFEAAVGKHPRTAQGQPRLPGDMTSNPIKWLADALRRDSPMGRLPDVQSLEQRVELGALKLLIRPA